MRKMRKQPIKIFDAYDWSVEPGERVWDNLNNKIYDIIESNGVNKSRNGELTFKEPNVQKAGKTPVKVNNIWYWK